MKKIILIFLFSYGLFGCTQAMISNLSQRILHRVHEETHAPIELYDLSADTGESQNLADQHPDLVRKAEQLLTEAHTPSPHYQWKYLTADAQ